MDRSLQVRGTGGVMDRSLQVHGTGGVIDRYLPVHGTGGVTQTHAYTDCSRNWVLILVRMEIL